VKSPLRYLQPFLSQEPVPLLIRETAVSQWRLLFLNVTSTLLEAVTEGGTLAVVFLAVQLLSEPNGLPNQWINKLPLSLFPEIAKFLNDLPPQALVLGLLLLAVLIQTLQALAKFFNKLSVGYFAARCRAKITARIHSEVLSWSFPCASRYKVGDLADHANAGPEAIRVQIEQSNGLVVSCVLCLTYLGVLIGISPWLLFAVTIIGTVIVLIQKKLLPRIRNGSRHIVDLQISVFAQITENFQILRLLHSTGQLDAADHSLSNKMITLEEGLRRQATLMSIIEPLISLLPILAISSVCALSILLLDGRGGGVLPSLVTFVLALQRLTQRLSTLAVIGNYLAQNSGRLGRLNQILSHGDKQFRRIDGYLIKSLEREIRFESVALQYPTSSQQALVDVSFTLSKGKTLALVGPSGAGKSSIADLLSCLYDATSGEIFVDNLPLSRVNVASWQNRIGVVSQDIQLFNASIAENVAFGVESATDLMIEDACKAAAAHSFITSLPNGYRTIVGERGYRLSGGQRQRLAMARAVLKNPDLLILDEATSALDSQTEQAIQHAVDALRESRAILVIAHRLATVVNASEIIVMGGGSVVERGTHSSLLQANGYYKKLWELQSEA
jgi:ATP-binding cassette subfamily B protein/subfamily B ATP-binding cassette protein MsbA